MAQLPGRIKVIILKCCKCGKRTRKFTQICQVCGHRFCKLCKGGVR